MTEAVWAIGLMSGTSMDGVDAALLKTDGHRIEATGLALTHAYPDSFRTCLQAVLGLRKRTDAVASVEAELTEHHVRAVNLLMAESGLTRDDIEVIGFHGHTITHVPAENLTWQIGNATRLAQATSLPVVHDLRAADVAAGGQGAPLAPVYHGALAGRLDKPVAFLNIGGVANLTYIGADGRLIAFDTGPGNALIDDFMWRRARKPRDENGTLAAQGRVNQGVLGRLMDNSYFTAKPPKSLDRLDFTNEPARMLADGDGAATLTAFTVECVVRAAALLPEKPETWLVCGGGRHNATIMRMLAERLAAPVRPVEGFGWDGDALEAQAFAFLAVRHLLGLALTYPETTGAPRPLTGGHLIRP